MGENEQKSVDVSFANLVKTRTESLAVIHAVQGDTPAADLVLQYAELSDAALFDLAANVYKTKFEGSRLTKETFEPWLGQFNTDKSRPADRPGVQKTQFTFQELLQRHRMKFLFFFLFLIDVFRVVNSKNRVFIYYFFLLLCYTDKSSDLTTFILFLELRFGTLFLISMFCL